MAEKVSVSIELIDRLSNDLRRVRGNVKSDTKGMSQSFKGVSSAVKGVGAAFAGLAVASKVSAFAKESIELAKRQVQAEQALKAALGGVNQGLLDYAAALQKQTTFGDEAIIEAQALIGAFIKEEGQIKRLTPAILDLAAAKNMDLRSAADMVTKSVASSTNSLSRYGIEVEGAAGSTERIDSAVRNLTSAYGGFAKELAQTDVGQIQQLENEIGDLKETLGKDLLPLQKEWNQTLLETFGYWSDIYSKIKGIFKTSKKEQKSADEILLENLKVRKKELEKIVDTQNQMRDAGAWTILGPQYQPDVLADAEKRLEGINKKLKEIQGKSAPSRKPPSAPPKSNGGGAPSTSNGGGGGGVPSTSVAIEAIAGLIDMSEVAQIYAERQTEIWSDHYQAKVDLAREAAEAERQVWQQYNDDMKMTQISVAQTVASTILDINAQAAKRELDLQKKKIQDSNKSEKRKQKEIYALEKEAFERDKKRAMLETFINGTVAAIRAWVNPGYPLAIPLTIAIGAQQTASMAMIASQKFAAGGIVEGPTSGDRVPVMANGGEMFLTRNDQNQLLSAIRSGGLGGRAVTINVQGGGSAMENAEAFERTYRKLQFQGRI